MLDAEKRKTVGPGTEVLFYYCVAHFPLTYYFIKIACGYILLYSTPSCKQPEKYMEPAICTDLLLTSFSSPRKFNYLQKANVIKN